MEELTFKPGDWVLHPATGLCAVVAAIHAPGDYRDANGNTFPVPVVLLSTGDCLLAYVEGEQAFVVLTDEESTGYQLMCRLIGFVIVSVVQWVRTVGIEHSLARVLWNAALGRAMKAGLP